MIEAGFQSCVFGCKAHALRLRSATTANEIKAASKGTNGVLAVGEGNGREGEVEKAKMKDTGEVIQAVIAHDPERGLRRP